jgi:hypothetical protein
VLFCFGIFNVRGFGWNMVCHSQTVTVITDLACLDSSSNLIDFAFTTFADFTIE